MTLTNNVEAALTRHAMLPRGSKVLAAVSGGADSIALLLALRELAARMGYILEAIHIEHGIRGMDSTDDARFVEQSCAKLDVHCTTVTVDAPSAAKRFGGGLEDAARRLRYDAFERVADKRGVDRIALAHHLKDQAETALLHIIRGSGVSGLEGMRPVRGRYIRPLLEVSPESLREALNCIGQPWREDATNNDPHQPRAMLRHHALPLLERINPGVIHALTRTAGAAQRDNDYLDGIAGTFLKQSLNVMPYGAFMAGLHKLDGAIASRALRLLPVQLGLESWESSHIESIMDMRTGSAVNLPFGWTAKRSGERVHVIAPESLRVKVDFNPPPLEVSPAVNGASCNGRTVQCIQSSLLKEANWRTRLPGDWIQPFGMSGKRSLSDVFIDRKIDEPFRDYVPLLCVNNEVLWAVGVGASEKLRAGKEPSDVYVTLRWLGDIPWIIKE